MLSELTLCDDLGLALNVRANTIHKDTFLIPSWLKKVEVIDFRGAQK